MGNRHFLAIIIAAAALAACGLAWAVKTDHVELGLNGVYDGAVRIERDAQGNLAFVDEQVTSPTLLTTLVSGARSHAALSGLQADDHPQYLNAERHLETHSPAFNDALPISADVDGNTDLNGHTADSAIHLNRLGNENVSGNWTFSGIPEIRANMRFSANGGAGDQSLIFEAGAGDARMDWKAVAGRFEFNRPLYAAQAAFDEATLGAFSVSGTLSGAGTGALANWANIEGIAPDNLLDKSKDEDVAGQWDFLAPARFLDEARFDASARMTQSAAPVAQPDTGALYVDESDGRLKFLDASGATALLAGRAELDGRYWKKDLYEGGLAGKRFSYGYVGDGAAMADRATTGTSGNLFVQRIFEVGNALTVDDANGRTGLGTAAPLRRLHVYHSADNELLQLESGDQYAGLELKDNGGTFRVYGNQGGLLMQYANGAGTAIAVDNTGRVGIGTAAPSVKLDVSGQARCSSLATGGNELLAHDVARHTVTGDEATSHSAAIAWTKAAVASVVQMSALRQSGSILWQQGDPCAFDGSQVTVYDGSGAWSAGDELTVHVTYQP